MALLHVQYFSDVLSMCTSMDVILPQNTHGQIGLKGVCSDTYPTLYLLHGLSDDQTIWQRRTSIERYVSELGWAVVMPTTFRFWYTDCTAGRFFTHIAKELPAICRGFFPNMSDDPAKTYVAGISMGGYGAWKAALSCPETFGAAASLSGALLRGTDSCDGETATVFGANPKGKENDLCYLMEQCKTNGAMPRLYQWCGTEDFLYADNRRIKEYAESIGWGDYTYRESHGDHSWEYWDEQIKAILAWLASNPT